MQTGHEQALFPIRTEEDYQRALRMLDELMAANDDIVDRAYRHALALLVEDYERRHHPIPLPDPIEAIEAALAQRGWKQRNLVEAIQESNSRVSEALNRQRRMSLNFIRKVARVLSIPVEVLVQEYPLGDERSTEGARPRPDPRQSWRSRPSSPETVTVIGHGELVVAPEAGEVTLESLHHTGRESLAFIRRRFGPRARKRIGIALDDDLMKPSHGSEGRPIMDRS